MEIETFEKEKKYEKDLSLYKKKEFFDLYAHKIRAVRFPDSVDSNQLGEEFIEGYQKATERFSSQEITTPDTDFLPLQLIDVSQNKHLNARIVLQIVELSTLEQKQKNTEKDF